MHNVIPYLLKLEVGKISWGASPAEGPCGEA